MSKVEAMLPQLRFEGFSESWAHHKVVEWFTIIDGDRGVNYPKASDFKDKGHCLFLNAKNVTKTGFLFNELSFISKEKDESMSKGKLSLNDLILTTRGTVGNIALYDKKVPYENIRINSGMLILRKNKRIRDEAVSFFYQFFYSDLFYSYLARTAFGSAQPQLTVKDIKNLCIAMPIAEEQTKIGELFQKLDRAIELQQQKVEQSERYKKAMLQKMFPQKGEKVPRVRFEGFSGDWHEQKLEKLGSFRRGSFPQPYGLAKWYDPNGMPFVQVYDVDDNMLLKPETKQRISTLAQKESVFVPKGRLVLTIQGSIGRIAKTQYDSYVDRTLLIFEELNPKIQIDYFKYVVFLLFEIEKSKAPGGTIKTITKKVLSDFVVLFPSLKEQTAIGNFFHKLDQNIESERAKLEQYQTMKRAMLQRMFV